MNARGGTNSNPPMNLAKDLLSLENEKHRDEANRTSTDYREPLKFVVFMTDGQNTTGNFFVIPGNTGRYYGQINGRWFVTRRLSTALANGFTEGDLSLDSDSETLNACRNMRNEGVTIFTIGFALDPGFYYNQDNPNDPKEVTNGVQAAAFGLLSQCASSQEHFIIAGQNNDLQSAFNTIQNSIVKELIRIKS